MPIIVITEIKTEVSILYSHDPISKSVISIIVKCLLHETELAHLAV